MCGNANMLLRHVGTSIVLVSASLAVACAEPAVHQSVSTGPSPVESRPSDRRVLAGEWEYVDGERERAVDRLILDGDGNGRYHWKNGRFETIALIGHIWQGIWFQKENDRDGGFTVEFSSDFSEGEGRWWYSRIGTDHAPLQKGGTFHLSKKTARMSHVDPSPAP
jgi:hypothetical protein